MTCMGAESPSSLLTESPSNLPSAVTDIWWPRAVLFSDEVFRSSLLFMQWSTEGHLQTMCTGAESPSSLLTESPQVSPLQLTIDPWNTTTLIQLHIQQNAH